MKRNMRQVVFPLLAAMIWGSSFVAQSMGAELIRSFTFNASRSVAAVVFLSLLLFILRRIRPQEKRTKEYRRELVRGGIVCGTLLTLGTNLQQLGIESTGAGKAGFITALYIVLVPLFGGFFGKKVSRRIWLCVLIAVGGLYCLCFSGETEFSLRSGDFYVFLCAFAFTGQIIAIDRYVQRVDGLELSLAQFVVVTVLSSVGALCFETVDIAAVGACMSYILYVGIFSSGVAYTLQILAQRDGDAAVVSLLLSLESFFAVVASALVLNERLTGREYVGCVLMLCAVLLSQLPENKCSE